MVEKGLGFENSYSIYHRILMGIIPFIELLELSGGRCKFAET